MTVTPSAYGRISDLSARLRTRMERTMGSGFSIEWDDNALNNLAEEVTKEYAVDLQKRIDNLCRLHKGKPVEEIKPYLEADFRANDGGITEPDLTEWAQMISDGTKIQVVT